MTHSRGTRKLRTWGVRVAVTREHGWKFACFGCHCRAKTATQGERRWRAQPMLTMIPSVTSKISSKFTSPSWFSILAMILMWRPRGPSVWAHRGDHGGEGSMRGR
jgi:hypothetical protein